MPENVVLPFPRLAVNDHRRGLGQGNGELHEADACADERPHDGDGATTTQEVDR